MELALYCPDSGYYEAGGDRIGAAGDYYTSVSTGPLFGWLLAWQFAQWLPLQGGSIVEAGAHDGKLAADILGWFRDRRPGLFEHLEYVIVEPSARRREWQQRTLAPFGDKVHWRETLSGNTAGASGAKPIHGVIFCNELLDALPVHRLGWDATNRLWFEWGVALDGGRFTWTKMPAPLTPGCPAPIEAVLPDGFTTEICPAAEAWWREAAAALASGRLLTIDYGFEEEEQFAPGRAGGTLRAYSRHHASSDLLAMPGEQDLTAHVNFSRVRAAGEGAGLKTECFEGQGRFLTGLLERVLKPSAGFGNWQPAWSRQFQTLTHPDHLGRAFRVLVQSRRAG